MIKNYFKIGFRALLRNKSYSIINILGLVIGISFSCMLYMYVSNELSYDTFHSKSDRIFRILTIDKRMPENVRYYGVTVPPLGKELVANYPEVTDMVRLHRFSGQIVFEIDGQNFQERNWYTADANLFEVFDFQFVAGDRTTALDQPFSLVLTESMAKKYFGDKDPITQTIKTEFGQVKVTGVIKDHPDNSHLKFDMLFSSLLADQEWTNYLNSWEEFGAFTYIVLNDKNAVANLRAKMPMLREKFGKNAATVDVDFQGLEDIYLRSDEIENGTEAGHGQMSYIYIFSTMGIFLLVIACINYINLATSKAMARSKEVGVRKVVGAHQKQLIAQFLTEAVIITVISMILAIGVMDLAFPFFNQITGKNFDINFTTMGTYLPSLLVISLIIGIVSGGYPAFYLSKLKPVASLKGKVVSNGSTVNLRKVLVVFQFALTIVMIISTMVIGRQMNFIQNKDVGFDKDKLVIVDINNGDIRPKFQAMKNEFSKVPGVQKVAVSSRVPGEWKNIVQLEVKSSADENPGYLQSYFMGFDESMLDTYQLQLATGTYFPPNGQVDSSSVLMNESAVHALGLTDPVGSVIRMKTRRLEFDAKVIGVIKDFNFQSLHQKVAPIIVGTWNNPIQRIDYFTLKISGNIENALKDITRVHEAFDNETPIEYHFLDQQLNSFYVAEQRAGMIFRMGGALSIFVACLGLFGLATYTIERRSKEVGIRKVLGASVADLFMLLSSSFAKQVSIAFLVASPIAYFIMNNWLDEFEYKISLSPLIFLLAGAIAMVVALVTVGYRSLKAAGANPLNALRQE
ncbi:MAG: ABC transporter permease [Bacteroidota bacterium]